MIDVRLGDGSSRSADTGEPRQRESSRQRSNASREERRVGRKGTNSSIEVIPWRGKRPPIVHSSIFTNCKNEKVRESAKEEANEDKKKGTDSIQIPRSSLDMLPPRRRELGLPVQLRKRSRPRRSSRSERERSRPSSLAQKRDVVEATARENDRTNEGPGQSKDATGREGKSSNSHNPQVVVPSNVRFENITESPEALLLFGRDGSLSTSSGLS